MATHGDKGDVSVPTNPAAFVWAVGGGEKEACLGSPVFVICSRVPKVSTSVALGVSQCWAHSFLSVTSMFRALGCDRL